jgi:hypothetical protein
MNSDDFSLFVFILIIAIIINWIILKEIIASGSKSAKILLEETKQTLILSAMAKQQGVDESVLNAIIKIDRNEKLQKIRAKNYPPEPSASYEQGKKIGAAISKLTGKR